MKKIHFGGVHIPVRIMQDVPHSYSMWGKALYQDCQAVQEDLCYQSRQNAAMDLLHLAALSIVMLKKLGYTESDIEWLMLAYEDEHR